MVIVYIALALIVGIAAATTTLFAGAGVLAAIGAYILTASATISLCALWILLPLASPEPRRATQGTWQRG